MKTFIPQLQIAEGMIVSPLEAVTNDRIEEVEARLLAMPQIPMPVTHRYSPGIYTREIFMPAGTFVIGHEHKTRHLNIVLTGRALVMINGRPMTLEAPFTFESEEHVRKVLFILEDMRFVTIHANPTNERSVDILEESLIVKSPSFLEYHKDLGSLRQIIEDHEQSPPVSDMP